MARSVAVRSGDRATSAADPVNCPDCDGDAKITDSKKLNPAQAERKRRCQNCGLVFETLADERLVARNVKAFIRTSSRYREKLQGVRKG